METFCFQEVTLEILITTHDVLNSFLREVLDYSGIATTSAKVLDGIDIQVKIFLSPFFAISHGAR